jgi:membrane-bound lytic murein transglycosylase D
MGLPTRNAEVEVGLDVLRVLRKTLFHESQQQGRSMLTVSIILLASGAIAVPQQVPPWENMHRDIEAKLDQQLERISNFEALDARFRANTQSSAAPTERDRVDSSPASSLAVTRIPPAVGDFVRFYSGPGRSFYENATHRLQQYLPMMKEIFSREGVPPDLIWIGLVESAYNPAARSPRAAVGIWQLIPETASRYGLAVGTRVDERTDPVKSTVAAARFLRHLYAVFGDWNLVLAAYNSGEQRLVQSIARGGTKNFWELVQRQLLPRETQDYVPAVLAARLISEILPRVSDVGLAAHPASFKNIE